MVGIDKKYADFAVNRCSSGICSHSNYSDDQVASTGSFKRALGILASYARVSTLSAAHTNEAENFRATSGAILELEPLRFSTEDIAQH